MISRRVVICFGFVLISLITYRASTLIYSANPDSFVEMEEDFLATSFINSMIHQKMISLDRDFYDESRFASSLASANFNIDSDKNIRAVVAPHHLLASELIARSMLLSKNNNIDKIFLVGPDHENHGGSEIMTGAYSWETPFGYVETNIELANVLIKHQSVSTSFETLSREHSVGVFMPYIKRLYPKASIIPILFSSYANERDCEYITDFLTKFDSDRTLVIFSIDFSHYLSETHAYKKDRETLDLIENRDYSKILRLTSDHIDSPATLVTALMYSMKNKLSFELIYHGNSNDFLRTSEASTTSYMGFISKSI